MDQESEKEFQRVWKRMERFEKDSRDLIRVSEAVKVLAKKVDRFSFAVTSFALAVVVDIASHYIK